MEINRFAKAYQLLNYFKILPKEVIIGTMVDPLKNLEK